jgi:GGDEF domain-containing protein
MGNNGNMSLGGCPDDVMLARFAGDEFVALIPGPRTRAELTALSNRIVHALTRPFLIEGNEVVIGASIGIALYPTDAAAPDGLLRLSHCNPCSQCKHALMPSS